MGYKNVAAVFVLYQHLGHREKLALTFMANFSLDAPKDGQEPRRYFAGHAAVARALGLEVPPTTLKGRPAKDDLSPDAVAWRKRASSLEVVRRVVKTLRAAGALRVVRAGAGRVEAEYELCLDVGSNHLTAPGSPNDPSGLPPAAGSPSSRNDPSGLSGADDPSATQRSVGGNTQRSVGYTPNDPLEIAPTVRRTKQEVQEEEHKNRKGSSESVPETEEPAADRDARDTQHELARRRELGLCLDLNHDASGPARRCRECWDEVATGPRKQEHVGQELPAERRHAA